MYKNIIIILLAALTIFTVSYAEDNVEFIQRSNQDIDYTYKVVDLRTLMYLKDDSGRLIGPFIKINYKMFVNEEPVKDKKIMHYIIESGGSWYYSLSKKDIKSVRVDMSEYKTQLEKREMKDSE